jgi:uroporphyrinogen-III decarboxylase
VREYCKKLISVVGKGGGFMMDGASGIPDETKPENLKAMEETTKEFGIYG